ncbi:hypothetical protein HDE_02990 [Halotydeus destructor]|nr:hypothetical protein HDE_02990 [Halotydeus destructor]
MDSSSRSFLGATEGSPVVVKCQPTPTSSAVEPVEASAISWRTNNSILSETKSVVDSIRMKQSPPSVGEVVGMSPKIKTSETACDSSDVAPVETGLTSASFAEPNSSMVDDNLAQSSLIAENVQDYSSAWYVEDELEVVWDKRENSSSQSMALSQTTPCASDRPKRVNMPQTEDAAKRPKVLSSTFSERQNIRASDGLPNCDISESSDSRSQLLLNGLEIVFDTHVELSDMNPVITTFSVGDSITFQWVYCTILKRERLLYDLSNNSSMKLYFEKGSTGALERYEPKRCPECRSTFENELRLKTHPNCLRRRQGMTFDDIVNTNHILKCEYCSWKSPDRNRIDKVRKHYAKNHLKKMFACKHCWREFTDSSSCGMHAKKCARGK